jgi:glycerol-3-phosphate acyltransferase PlsX
MGSDRGPEVIVRGALTALSKLQRPVILVGDENIISSALAQAGIIAGNSVQVVHAPDVITMDDTPSTVIRKRLQASVRVAFELVEKGEASGVVSAGNTGGMMAAGLYAVGALPGILRPAIATLIPKIEDLPPTVLIDSGANVDCHAHQLVQFALMGRIYAKSVLKIDRPRVALVSNGSEASKGTDILRSTSQLLRDLPEVNFIGYVEGRDLPHDRADVVVCDGFVGNVLLKAMEGSVELVVGSMRHHVTKSFWGRVGLWIARNRLKALFRGRLNPSAYGGAPLLGLRTVAIVCHGSADEEAIRNALAVAERFVDANLVQQLDEALGDYEGNLSTNAGG